MFRELDKRAIARSTCIILYECWSVMLKDREPLHQSPLPAGHKDKEYNAPERDRKYSQTASFGV